MSVSIAAEIGKGKTIDMRDHHKVRGGRELAVIGHERIQNALHQRFHVFNLIELEKESYKK